MEPDVIDRGHRNLEAWRQLVGVGSTFPKLREIPNSEVGQRTYERPGLFEEILRRAQTRPLTVLEFEPGHGCTTAFRHLCRVVRGRGSDLRIIPLRMEALVGGPLEPPRTMVQPHLATELMRSEWADAITPTAYDEMTGALDHTGDPEEHRSKLTHVLQRIEAQEKPYSQLWKRFEQLCPVLARPIDDVLDTLGQAGISVLIVSDLSGSVSASDVYGAVGSLKDLVEIEGIHEKWNEIHFLNRDMVAPFESAWRRPYDRVWVPPYTAEELYEILWRHYAPLDCEKPEINGLDTIGFPLPLVRRAWSEGARLEDIAGALEAEMASLLDCGRSEIFAALAAAAEGES